VAEKKKRKILVVDDELDMLMVIKLRLEASGYEVMTATDGLEGLNSARKDSPDLIVLDIMLPKMNGYKVARFLKFDEEYKKIPIVMLTALGGDEDRATGIETGADEYLTKPFETEQLLSAVRKYLGA
jgi:DNA-binding response OmpR family regulator